MLEMEPLIWMCELKALDEVMRVLTIYRPPFLSHYICGVI